VPSDESERSGETAEVLADSELLHDLLEGLADVRAGRVYSADEVAEDLVARQAAGD